MLVFPSAAFLVTHFYEIRVLGSEHCTVLRADVCPISLVTPE